MGDHCWVGVTCRTVDRSAFEEIGFVVERENDDGSVFLTQDSANHAADSELRELGRMGIVFLATHGPGGEYGDGAYASYGRRFLHVDCLAGGLPAVEVNADGNPDPDQLRAVRQYLEVAAAAKEIITGRASQPTAPARILVTLHVRGAGSDDFGVVTVCIPLTEIDWSLADAPRKRIGMEDVYELDLRLELPGEEPATATWDRS